MPICWKCGFRYDGPPRPCERCGSPYEYVPSTSSWFTRLSLIFGQLVSLLGCVSAACYGLLFTVGSLRVRARVEDYGLLLLGCVAVVIYSWAMFVVFSRVRRM